MICLVVVVFLSMTAVMTAGWVYQRGVSNGGWADVFWTFGTGTSCALAALAPMHTASALSPRQVLVAALVAAWGARLGFYVLGRVRRSAEDARYAGFRREWGGAFQRRMFILMAIQAPASALLSISVVLAAHNPSPGLSLSDLVGVIVLAISVIGEAIADGQMKTFKANPANSAAVCEAGLWSWSRHPNYFFEAIGWLAYPVIAIRLSDPWSLASLVAPVLMFALLRFGSGVPPLEAAMLRSKGDAYRRYQARVSPMFPRPPKEIP